MARLVLFHPRLDFIPCFTQSSFDVQIAEKAEAFLEKGRGPAAVKEAEKKPVLYVIDPEGHFTMTFQAEDDHVEKQVQIYPSGQSISAQKRSNFQRI